MYSFLLFIGLIGAANAAPQPTFDWMTPEEKGYDLSKEDLTKDKPTKDDLVDRFPPCGANDEENGLTWVYAEQFKRCYLVLSDVNFEKAKEMCEEQNSHLVSIHSPEENQFVASLIFDNETRGFDRDSLLLGAQKVNGSFEWLDGTVFSYQTWAAGEPNNWKPTPMFSEEPREENEDCLAMYTNPINYLDSVEHLYRWNDNICSGYYEYAMCKKAADY